MATIAWVVPLASLLSLLVFAPGLARLFRGTPQRLPARLDLGFLRAHLATMPSFFVIQLFSLLDYQADILIAGGRNLYTALKARIPFLDINQEREFGYAGYTGMAELARQLHLSISSPIWPAVRQPAPWADSRSLGQVLSA